MKVLAAVKNTKKVINMTDNKQRLMDCPNCNGKAYKSSRTEYRSNSADKEYDYIECEVCGLRADDEFCRNDTVERVWNTRANPLPDICLHRFCGVSEGGRITCVECGEKKPEPASLPDNKEVGELVKRLLKWMQLDTDKTTPPYCLIMDCYQYLSTPPAISDDVAEYINDRIELYKTHIRDDHKSNPVGVVECLNKIKAAIAAMEGK